MRKMLPAVVQRIELKREGGSMEAATGAGRGSWRGGMRERGRSESHQTGPSRIEPEYVHPVHTT